MADGIVVPVEKTATLRATVGYAAAEAAEVGADTLHFVYLAVWRDDDPHVEKLRQDATDLLEQVSVWAEYDLEDADAPDALDVRVETATLGTDAYLFGPGQYADRLHEYAEANGLGTVLLDPEYTPVGNSALLQPMEFELSRTGLSVREAPVDRPSRRERIVSEVTGLRFGAVFVVSLLFYLVLGDPTYPFDLVTGVASAAIVAITLSQVTLDHDPTAETPKRLARGVVYIPVLLWEILKSNLVVARVILSPSLPIEPATTRMRVLVGSGLPLTTLANSITLTPGTLTVRASDEDLIVHTLIPWAREGLFEGSLERWTRLIFYGREAARLPTPKERGDCDVLQGPDATAELPFAKTDGGHDRDNTEMGSEPATDAEVTDE